MLRITSLIDVSEINHRIIHHDAFSVQLQPTEQLQPFITHYNVVFPKGYVFTENYTLLPNGCSTLSFSIKDQQVTGELWGTFTEPIHLGEEPLVYDCLLLIELQPSALYQMTQVDSLKYRNMRLPLGLINDSLNREIMNCLNNAVNLSSFVYAVDQLLQRHILVEHAADAIANSVRHIMDTNGQITVPQLAKKVHVSERTLNRLFNKHIGMSAKAFSRIIRVNYVLNELKKPQLSLTELAHKAGYADQSHFIHDFQNLCRVSPTLYAHNLADFYNAVEPA